MDVEILAIASPFLTAILILLIIFVSKILRDKSKNEVLMKALEKGVELSPEFFKNEPVKKKQDPLNKQDPLTSALVTIGVGIGLFIALYLFFNDIRFAAFGFIPFFVGLGQLIGYLVSKKRKTSNLDLNDIDE
ncbi:MAG: DUF6249 domain-containing protein [Bacteroidales bacterium]